jgi:hypothetical protein
MRRLLGLMGLAVCWGLAFQGALADDWRPVRANADLTRSPVFTLPPIQLGKPIAAPSQAESTSRSSASRGVIAETPALKAAVAPPKRAGLAKPTVIRAQGAAGLEEAYNCGVVSEGPPAAGGPFIGSPAGGWFGDLSWNYFYRGSFESDKCFPNFISPVSNPFFFEDPRALTELRPIFMYQRFPNQLQIFTDLGSGVVHNINGGTAEFFGLQGRLALSDNFSLVFSKLGGIAMQPDGFMPGALDNEVGFAEIAFGPKWTFWRNDCTNTIAAIGANFEVAIGSASVFQDTGTGGVTPYITFGQELFRNLHILAAAGYRFRFDDDRSALVFTSLHVDYGIIGRVYPLVELNWYHYTQNGKHVAAGFEGQDLFMFGSNSVSGNDVLTLAAGVRFKIVPDFIEAGLVYEFPLSNREDLLDYRITADLIFRY